jgi:hypothetical protein
MRECEPARRTLAHLRRELMDLHPSAARSLEEGMEETFTVHKPGMPRPNGLPEWEAMAGPGSDRTLGRLRPVRSRAAVPEGDGLPADPNVAVVDGECRF